MERYNVLAANLASAEAEIGRLEKEIAEKGGGGAAAAT